MKCENEKCRYEFFEREEHYICCPQCGEVVSENFPEEDSFLRGKAYIDLCSYKKYLKKEKCFVIIFGILYIGLECISFDILFSHVHPSLGYIPDHAIQNVEGTKFLSTLLPVFLFISDININQMYKKIFGELVWICRSGWFKIIKGTVLLVFAIFMSTKVIPDFYDHCPEVFAYCNNSSLVKMRLTILYQISLWYVCVVMVISDINDIYKRKRCENMSMWC